MKKILLIILTMMIFSTVNVLAANGDIVGNIYSTDIKACINGVWVDSYNIGGKTVVVVEDITNQFRYYDALRTLIIDDLAPERLVSGRNTGIQKPGNVIGNIYETDIKTYYRGKELTSYSLNGKMAIVIEELGADNTFSKIGGKFIWNPNNRTIVLESMYRYPYSMRSMMEDAGYNIILKESDYTYRLEAEPTRAPLTGGYILCEKEIPDNAMIRVTYKGETIGYRCMFPEMVIEKDENGVYVSSERQTAVDYFYTDKVEDMIFHSKVVTPTAEDWLNYFKNHTVSTIKDSFETDEYMFLYMFSNAMMSGSDRLIKINKSEGTKIEYQDSLDSNRSKRFEDVVIDRENEKVYFYYDNDYVVNLKTDEVRVYQKLETDIGTGSSDGQPSEYNYQCARNGQYEYKLISGEAEKVVKGFCVPDFYYSNMLPLEETFDFLNIKYSFENDILTIDTSEAKDFVFEQTENKVDILSENPLDYLYVNKVLLNGKETEITYQYTSGHFQNTHHGTAKAKPYVCNGKVYINHSFIKLLCEQKETIENKEGLVVQGDASENVTNKLYEESIIYKIHLTDKKQQTKECDGAFVIKYTPDDVTFTGDAEYFSSSIHSNGNEYEILIDFSNDSFGASELIQIFGNISSGSQALPIHNEEEKYDLVNEKIKIMINGQNAEKIAVKRVSWKGSTTVYMYVRDIKPIPINEIQEFSIIFNK